MITIVFIVVHFVTIRAFLLPPQQPFSTLSVCHRKQLKQTKGPISLKTNCKHIANGCGLWVASGPLACECLHMPSCLVVLLGMYTTETPQQPPRTCLVWYTDTDTTLFRS